MYDYFYKHEVKYSGSLLQLYHLIDMPKSNETLLGRGYRHMDV